MVIASSPLLQQAVRLHQAGRLDRAVRFYLRALRDDPGQSDALHGLGVIAFQQGDDTKAIEQMKAAIALRGDVPLYHYDLGNVWRKLGRKTDAVLSYLRATEFDHQYFDALFNMGAVLCELVRPTEAAQALRLAVRLRPEYPEAHLLLGLCLERMGQIDAAVERYLAVLSLRRDDPRAYLLLGGALFKAGHAADADLAFARALALDPNQPAAHSRRIAALNYRDDLSAREVAEAHLEWGRRHTGRLQPTAHSHANTPDPARRLRVGYVSPNLFRHSVAHFLLPVLRAHDRRQVEVFCYSNSIIVDGTTRALQAASDHWRAILGASDEEVATQIRADGIDILVDLAGHTGDGRLLAFARRPAPVQVAWLGYPQTTGVSAVDYRLSDAIVEPLAEADAISAEKIIRLPNGFHCFGRPGESGRGDDCERDALEVGPPPALANGFVTFGSFNTVQKMPPSLVALWAGVLHAVPGSRLLLKSLPDIVIADRYQALFADQGIDPTRIEFLRWTTSRPEHLRLYHRMDIALDTFPYHGTTTTCEALWMGVPVLSLCGDAHISRVGASLLTQIGLTDWIADSKNSYVEKAARQAADLSSLTLLRAKLRDKMRESSLCDAPGFTREIEGTYRAMWQAWCRADTSAEQKLFTFS